MNRSRKHIERIQISKRINYLKRAIDVQEIVKKYGKYGLGYTHTWIYENVITAPGSTLRMSKSTFNNYMYLPAPRTELSRLESKLK